MGSSSSEPESSGAFWTTTTASEEEEEEEGGGGGRAESVCERFENASASLPAPVSVANRRRRGISGGEGREAPPREGTPAGEREGEDNEVYYSLR